MIIMTVVPKDYEHLYGQLVKKEQDLRGKGVFYRSTTKRRGYEKWSHVRYHGWIWFQKCLGGAIVVELQTKNPDEQWQILTSFVGFLDRYFKDQIASVSITYQSGE